MNFKNRDDVQAMIEMTPLHRLLSFRITAMDQSAGTLTIAADARGNAERSDGGGQAHGGAIATLIDTTATFAACIVAEKPVPTANLRVDYLRPAAGESMVATATVRKAGRLLATADVEVTSDGKLVAIGRANLVTGA